MQDLAHASCHGHPSISELFALAQCLHVPILFRQWLASVARTEALARPTMTTAQWHQTVGLEQLQSTLPKLVLLLAHVYIQHDSLQ